MSEAWEVGLPSAASTLRNLLHDADAASAPLWGGPQLGAAIFRYTEVFLPMLAVHRTGGEYNANKKNKSIKARIRALHKAANKKLLRIHSEVEIREQYERKEEIDSYISPFLALGTDVASIAPIPPLDVAFCWALHRLSPSDYAQDCERLYGMKLDPINRLEYANLDNNGDTRMLIASLQWACFAPEAVRHLGAKRIFPRFRKKKRLKERIPFLPPYLWPLLSAEHELASEEYTYMGYYTKTYKYPFEYDLYAAAKSEKQFLYKIPDIYFDEEEAMVMGARRYKRFLALMRDYPGRRSLVPTPDIHLVWKAHILQNTAGYERDTRKFVGKVINLARIKEDVDDEFEVEFRQTCQLWKFAYNEPYQNNDASSDGKSDICIIDKVKLCDSRERVFEYETGDAVREDESIGNMD